MKNFEFLKKRREAAQQNETSTSSSMIHPSHSAKNLGQFSPMNGGFKRPDFLNTHANKLNIGQLSNVQCPEEKQPESKY